MQTRQLTEDEFKATMSTNMHNVTNTANDVIDIWPYVDSVPATDLGAHSIYDRLVEVVYRSDDGCFDHVLVMTKTKNVFLAVVVDLAHDSIYGHRVLDLNREYGRCRNFTKGKLDFGPWEQIFYGEFDGRRSKRVLVKVIGE